MISLSNIIKGDNVLFDRSSLLYVKEPIRPKPIQKVEEEDKEKLLKQKEEAIALENKKRNELLNAENLKLKKAMKTYDEILERGNVEAKFAFEQGRQKGVEKAKLEGSKIGKLDGNKAAEKTLDEAIDNALNNIKSIDSKISANNDEIRADSINFAFGLAENILGISINRDKPIYKDLTSDFLSETKEKVTIKINEKPHCIETLQSEALLKAVDGLQGIFAYLDEQSEPDLDQKQVDFEKSLDNQSDQEDLDIISENLENKIEDIFKENLPTDLDKLFEESLKAADEQKPEIEDSKPNDDKVVVTPFEMPELKEGEEEIKPKIKVKKFAFENFDDNSKDDFEPVDVDNHEDIPLDEESSETDFENNKQLDDVKEDQLDEDFDEDEQEDFQNEIDENQEKFVFINPINKKSKFKASTGDDLTVEDIAQFDKDDLKAIIKKIDPRDLATTLSKESQTVVSAITAIMTRKNKDKVLEAIKYLGPVSETEVDEARQKLINIAKEN